MGRAAARLHRYPSLSAAANSTAGTPRRSDRDCARRRRERRDDGCDRDRQDDREAAEENPDRGDRDEHDERREAYGVAEYTRHDQVVLEQTHRRARRSRPRPRAALIRSGRRRRRARRPRAGRSPGRSRRAREARPGSSRARRSPRTRVRARRRRRRSAAVGLERTRRAEVDQRPRVAHALSALAAGAASRRGRPRGRVRRSSTRRWRRRRRCRSESRRPFTPTWSPGRTSFEADGRCSRRRCSATRMSCLTPVEALAAWFRSPAEVGRPETPSAFSTCVSARGTTSQMNSANSPTSTK